jgi:FkbM family methyltransferase
MRAALPDVYGRLAEKAKRDTNRTALNIAAGATRERREINISENTWSSSFLPLAERHRDAAPASRYVGTANVNIERLDDVLAGLHLGGTLYLKADTQGYELEVPAGGTATLARTLPSNSNFRSSSCTRGSLSSRPQSPEVDVIPVIVSTLMLPSFRRCSRRRPEPVPRRGPP